MEDFQFETLFVLPAFPAVLWLFFHILHVIKSKDKNGQVQTDDAEKSSEDWHEIERLTAENRQIKNECRQFRTNMEEWIKRAKDLNVKYNKLSEEFNMLKSQNSILFETLQSVNRANNKPEPEPEEKFVPVMTGIPERSAVLDSGVTFDELEAMVQVMKGSPVARNIKTQTINTIQKTRGTDLYNQLLDRIGGAKQQVDKVLNSEKQADSVKSDYNTENFDINNFI